MTQELLEREGGMSALLRDGSRITELAQLFETYSTLPSCFGVIEQAFLDAMPTICREYRETLSGASRAEYLKQVGGRARQQY